ncbi:MAG TPA: 23S rRNA pseudouridine(2604) synthase RluF [Haloplasmataceae bacterium]
MRINKYISESGICSRRDADRLILNQMVTINGKIAELGSIVNEEDIVKVNDIEIKPKKKHIYIALNKPVGIICTTDQNINNNIVDFVNYEERIFHIGRLDKDSEGLILLTNNGDIVNKILRAENNHEKEYLVTVDKSITTEFLENMAKGVRILGTITKPCKIKKISERVFNIILTQGLNRQIRRMCSVFNYKVLKLKRIRIMNIELGNLKTGEWRYLTNTELKELNKLLNI